MNQHRTREQRAAIALLGINLTVLAVAASLDVFTDRELTVAPISAAAGAYGALYLLYRSGPRCARLRATRRVWRRATGIAQLGELTALWLQRTIPTHPAYDGAPDRETDEIADTLIALNRTGQVVTTWSQPHYDGPDTRGSRWVQVPTVRMFATAEAMRVLTCAAHAAGLTVHAVHGVPRRRPTGHPVAWSSDNRPRRAPIGLNRRDLAAVAGWLSPAAAAEVHDAWQVTISDFTHPTRMWDVLDHAARQFTPAITQEKQS